MSQPPARRFVIEGLVIVVSILLAFAVDAAWDARKEAGAEEQLLEALVAEIEANRPELAARSRRGADARAAQHQLIDLIQPNPQRLSQDSLASLLRSSLSFGIAEIESSALAGALNGLTLEPGSRTDLIRQLRSYRTRLEDHRTDDREQWIALRSLIAEHLTTVAPYAFVWAEQSGHSTTDFEVPVSRLLRDPQLEGMMSQLSIRALQMTRSIETLAILADSIAVRARAGT